MAADPVELNRRPGRLRRFLRRSFIVCVIGFLVLTLASVVYNAVTTPPATLPAPDGADVVVDGVRVHYREWGSAGPAVVLVHGFAESTVSWQPVAELLAVDHHVVALDLAGFGYTDYSGKYSTEDEAALVVGLIKHLRLDRPVLVGHSMGASVVGRVALDQPQLIGGVVFADGDGLAFRNPDNPQAREQPAITRTPWFTSGYRLVTRTPWLHRPLMREVCSSTTCDGLTPELAEAWMRPMRQGDAERAMGSAGNVWLTPAQVRQIRVPRGIIWGEEDARQGGSLDGVRANLGRPPERLIVGAGHLSMVARPQAFAQAVRELVAELRRG